MTALPPIRRANLRFKVAPRPRTATTRICIHHTAGSLRQSVQDVHAGHRQRGFIGIGYNVVQDAEGVWWEGRGLDMEGAHATSYNDSSIGVCLIGNFEEHEVEPRRWESLVEMCAALCARYGLSAMDVVGHRELPGAATLCPGRHLDLSTLRRAVRDRLEGHPADSVPLWRVLVDGDQVGAYRSPGLAVQTALEQQPRRIVLERIEAAGGPASEGQA